MKSESLQDWPLCERFGITHANILERHTYLRVGAADAANMAAVRRIISEHAEDILTHFYAHLESFPELHEFLRDDQTVERLMATQRAYLLGLGQDSESLDYVETRLRFGAAHDSIGLESQWFLSAFAVMFDLIAEHLERHAAAHGVDALSALRSLSKAIWLDATLAVDTYHGAAMQRLEGVVSDLAAAEELSRTDELTGIANRRHLMTSLDVELARSKRFGLEFSVLFADVDYFKKVNDRFGHEAGDVVLREIAGLIRHSTRPADIVGRYGGEEFLVGLVHGGRETALEVAERVRQAVERASIQHDDHEIAVTVSIGVSAAGAACESLAEIIASADEGLYRAKTSGRNRVCETPSHEIGESDQGPQGPAAASAGR